MALIKCPECKKEISSRTQNCPNCGFPLHDFFNEIGGVNGNKKMEYIEYLGGDQYIGEMTENKRNGNGKYLWGDGSYYQGEFSNDLFHGCGKLYNSFGNVLVGMWENDKFIPRNNENVFDEPASSFEFDMRKEYKSVRIKKYIGQNTNIKIPDTINGLPVTQICSIPTLEKSVAKPVFPKHIESVILPNKLKHLGQNAFKNCLELKSVYINDSELNSFVPTAFDNCDALKNIYVFNSGAFCDDKYKNYKDITFFQPEKCSSLRLKNISDFHKSQIKLDNQLKDNKLGVGTICYLFENSFIIYFISDEFKEYSKFIIDDLIQFAENKTYKFNVLGNKIEISDCLKNQYTYLIPKSINGYEIIAIGNRAFNLVFDSSMEQANLVIPSTIKYIDGEIQNEDWIDYEEGKTYKFSSIIEIFCEINSAAEKYAIENKIKYSPIEILLFQNDPKIKKYLRNQDIDDVNFKIIDN